MQWVLSYMQNPSKVKRGFIPDITNILSKYGLLPILHAYIYNSATLPSKYSSKLAVKNVVNACEIQNWRSRMSADPDFIIFQQLKTSISTCLLYDMYTKYKPKHGQLSRAIQISIVICARNPRLMALNMLSANVQDRCFRDHCFYRI